MQGVIAVDVVARPRPRPDESDIEGTGAYALDDVVLDARSQVRGLGEVDAHEVVRGCRDRIRVGRELVGVERRLPAKGDRRRRFVAEPVHGLAARRRDDSQYDEGTEDDDPIRVIVTPPVMVGPACDRLGLGASGGTREGPYAR